MTVAQMVTYAYVQIDQARAELNAISKWTNYDRLKRRSQLMTRIAFPSRGHGRFKTVTPNRTPVQLPAVRVFTDRGWRWGGYWRTPIDYQHLSDDHDTRRLRLSCVHAGRRPSSVTAEGR